MDKGQLQAIFEKRAILRDGAVIQRISLFALGEMTREEVVKLADRLDRHRVAQMEQVLHQCKYNHKWWVRMPYTSQYLDPRLRFCPTCLEEERIEIGSVRLTIHPLSGVRISYDCPLCYKTTYIPLLPDFTFIGMTRDLLDENWQTTRIGWYCLPKHWPSVCKCYAWMEGRV